MDNPLLQRAAEPEHIKPRLLGHWGTTPGLNFIYVHLNRVIRMRTSTSSTHRPGHGGPGSWPTPTSRARTASSTRYPQGEEGHAQTLQAVLLPRRYPQHVAPETPGSIHEGGELGYSLSHAYGAAFDNPDLMVCCVVGDGEAETGPLATSWHSNNS